MTDLIEFLRARLDEDEERTRVADALVRSPWTSRVVTDATGYTEGRILCGDGYAVVHVEDQTPERAVAEHIAAWSPARVLTEVEAKRRILDEYERIVESASTYPGPANAAALIAMQQVVKLLGTPRADHPDYRQEWRP